ncbi:Putative high mobility group protein [Oxytricha trifallax]|uniref:Putative high mobility group protein n=1 Tax=Oxytricha trifallax TaxID=1172189 RepID=A0A073I0L1_9SPIT|nr:Putative high mobility group protein [Oxytricha trifallax]
MQSQFMQNQLANQAHFMPQFPQQGMFNMPMMQQLQPQLPMPMANPIQTMFNMIQENPAMKDQFTKLYTDFMQNQKPQIVQQPAQIPPAPKDQEQKSKIIPDIKKPLNAYIHFQNETIQKMMKEKAGSSLSSFPKQLSEKWQKMTPEEKKQFEILAEQDRARYFKEVQERKRLTGVSVRNKKKGQQRNAQGELIPRKTQYTSYFVFNVERMIELKKDNPKIMPPELTKITSLEWKAMSEERKQHYKKLAIERNNQSILPQTQVSIKFK